MKLFIKGCWHPERYLMKKSILRTLSGISINTGLVLVSLLVSLIVIELMLGASSLKYVNYAGSLSQKYFYQYYMLKENRGFDIRTNATRRQLYFSDGVFDIWGNNIGCFDYDVDLAEVREKGYILLVGDSFTWGFTEFRETAGVSLENRLEKRVLKCGVPSYGTRQELYKAKEIIDRIGTPPGKLILGYYVGNDVLNDYFFPELTVKDGYLTRTIEKFDVETGEVRRRDQADNQNRQSNFERYCVGYEPGDRFLFRLRCWLTRNSILYQLFSIMTRSQKFYPPYELIWTEEGARRPWMRLAWKRHLDGMREQIDRLGVDKEDVIVVIIPAKNSFVPKYWQNVRKDLSHVTIDPAAPYHTVSTYLSDNGIPHINLFPYFLRCGELDLYWTFDGHWNSSGNRVMADILYEYLNGNTPDPDKFCNMRFEL